MKIKMIGLYGNKNYNAWYRKSGLCFDFATRKEYASELTTDEVQELMANQEWYCKQYNAEKFMIED